MVFAEFPGAAGPAGRCVRDQASGRDFEAIEFGAVLDDLQASAAARAQRTHPFEQGAGVAPVAPRCNAASPKRVASAGSNSRAPVAILHVGRVDFGEQDQPKVSTRTYRLRPATFLPAS